jgi:outer membrane protein assembly factor BamD (BamD/ComL family)
MAIAAAYLAVVAGCTSGPGGGWTLLGKKPNPASQPVGQGGGQPSTSNAPPGGPATANQRQPPGQPPGQGVVQASYEQPRYVPPPSIRPEDLIKNENLHEAGPQKKTWWESVTENSTPGSITKGFKKFIGRGPNELLAKSKFEEGEAFFQQKNYKEAAKCFYIAADRWPDSALEEDAMYMLAESYFFDDLYPKASDTYAMLLKKYENTRYLTDITPRQFAIARYWDLKARIDSHWYPNLKDKTRPLVDATGHAMSVYGSVRTHDPTGPLADDATMSMANSYFLRNHFEDAAFHYELLRKDFPNSDFVLQAHVLGIRSKLRMYFGPQYEVKPLDDADKLIETTLTQFPADVLGDERERLFATKQLIRQERAQREFQSGEYYYKIRYYQAARYYYLDTIRDFADTPFAKMAEDRLEEIKNYPPVPYDYFGWLKKILPESDKNR